MHRSDQSGKYRDNQSPKLGACTLKDLSHMYKVCTKTIKKWLTPIESELGPRHGNFYLVSQVEKIVSWLGDPR